MKSKFNIGDKVNVVGSNIVFTVAKIEPYDAFGHVIIDSSGRLAFEENGLKLHVEFNVGDTVNYHGFLNGKTEPVRATIERNEHETDKYKVKTEFGVVFVPFKVASDLLSKPEKALDKPEVFNIGDLVSIRVWYSWHSDPVQVVGKITHAPCVPYGEYTIEHSQGTSYRPFNEIKPWKAEPEVTEVPEVQMNSEALNETAWLANDYLCRSGISIDGQLFNNMKGLCKYIIDTYNKEQANEKFNKS